MPARMTGENKERAMWFDDDEPDGFPHVVEDAVFAFIAIGIAACVAFVVKLAFFWG